MAYISYITSSTHDFKHSNRLILTGPSLIRCQVTVYRAPKQAGFG